MLFIKILKKIMFNALVLSVIAFKVFTLPLFWLVIKPIFWLKRKYLRLDKIKRESFSALNKFYNMEIDENDYVFEYSLLPGFKILHKHTRTTLGISQIVDHGISVGIQINCTNQWFDYPVVLNIDKSMKQLSKVFHIKQNVYINFDKGELSSVDLRLTLDRKRYGLNQEKIKHVSQLKLSPDFQLIHMHKLSFGNEDITNILYNKRFYSQLPLEDFFFLIFLDTLKDNSDVNALIPELNTPSAYDFNSEEFNQRLLLLEMLEY